MTDKKRRWAWVASMLPILAFSAILFGSDNAARASDSVSKEIDKAGASVKNAVRETGDYLKSDKFHEDMKRFTDGLSKAIKKGGDWLGQKLDGRSKSGSKTP
jgi:hypothetical protein